MNVTSLVADVIAFNPRSTLSEQAYDDTYKSKDSSYDYSG